jgi:outer membrane protein TolC
VSDVALVYYQIIKEYRVLEILRSSIEVSRFRYTLEDARKTVGAGTALDYNQALVDYRADSSLIIEQGAVIQQLEIQLNEIINRDLYDSLIHDNQIPLVEVLPAAEQLMDAANQNNKNLEVFRLNELVAESDERIARSFKYPQIDLFGNYSYNRSTNEVGFLRSNRNYGPQVGVRIRMNLFNGGNYNREIRNTQYARNIAKLDREALELNINSLILQQVARYRALTKRLEISEANVVSAGRALDVARAQLNEGTITGVDFRITQVTLISAENNREEILYTLKAVEIDLLRLMGQVTEYFL